MQQALAMVTAYDLGVQDDEFGIFKDVMDNYEENPWTMAQALTQLAWLFLRSLEEQGPPSRKDVLVWYGKQFADTIEALDNET